jgi:hypothetical protein
VVSPSLCVTFSNTIFLRWGAVSPRSSTKLVNHPLLGDCSCFLNIFAATHHTCRPCPPPATWGRAMPWWQRTHLNMGPPLGDKLGLYRLIL